MDSSDRWVTLAFTCNGLRALGVPEESLATFPEEFSRRHGGARRTSLATPPRALPNTGSAAWPVRTCTAIAILFSPYGRTVPALHRGARQTVGEDRRRPAVCPSSTSNATPPFNYAHDHFGFRDRLSQPVMKWFGRGATPGSGPALEPGEFILGYPGRRRAGRQSA